MKQPDYDYVKELKALRYLKEVVYQVLNDYEIHEVSPEVGEDQEMACVSLRAMLRLSRAYSAIGFCNNDC
jgi:hypothetical protein